MATSTAALKHVVVTGANSGIGLALCKRIVTEKSCYAYLGSRDKGRGEAALASIVSAFPEVAGKIEVLVIDVNDDASVAAAADSLKAKNVKLYAVVNNAGVGLAHGDLGGAEPIIETNYRGPKRVTAAFIDLIEPSEGRVVNTSSGVASMWLRNQDEATRALFSNPNLSQAELDAAIQNEMVAGASGKDLGYGGYGLSKAALTALTLVQAKAHPALKVTSLSPGFIDTPMTKGFGAKLSPEEGCLSSLHCLFGDVTSGWYYGSDGLRSPLTCSRDPGTPEYKGEPNPDPSVYNK